MKTMSIHKKKRMTEEDFKLMRMLLGKGMNGTETAQVLEVTPATVSTLRKFKTWSEYVQYKHEKAARYLASNRAKRATADNEPVLSESKGSTSNGVEKKLGTTPEPGIDYQILQQMKIVAGYLQQLVKFEQDKAKGRAEHFEKRQRGFFRS